MSSRACVSTCVDRGLSGRGLVVILLLAALGIGRAAEPAGAASGLPEARQVAFNLFEDGSGRRVGRIQVARIGLEYRKQGFLRVAWRPATVLEGVTLDLRAAEDLPAQGAQVARALRALGRREDFSLRDVCILLGGPSAVRIDAASARLQPDGVLVLSRATVAGTTDAPAEIGLWLAGPHAGQWRAQLPSPDRTKHPAASRPSTPRPS